MKEVIGAILIGLVICLFFILFLNEPKGYYESNPNEDIHYVWVEY